MADAAAVAGLATYISDVGSPIRPVKLRFIVVRARSPAASTALVAAQAGSAAWVADRGPSLDQRLDVAGAPSAAIYISREAGTTMVRV
jgi:hypothetical protein